MIGVGLGIMGIAGVVITHHRVDRANGFAVKYGAAASKGQATPTARCVGEMHHEYDTSNDARKATFPPKVLALLTPKICALGVSEGVVRTDGTMSTTSGYRLTSEIVRRMGVSRFQTLMFNELAVDAYHLARSGHVTRWDRCAAMGYSAYDGQGAKVKTDYPPRARMFRAVRDACTNGIARGLVPPSGAPTQRDTALLPQ